MTISNRLRVRYDGFSMAEMLLVVILVGILTVIAVPHFSMASVHAKSDEALVRKLAADLRKTRMMAIANAADNSDGYKLSITTSSPKKYEIINLQDSQTVETHDVDSRVTFSGTTEFSYTPLGSLNPTANVQLTVTGSGKSWLFDVYGYTGSVQYAEE